MGVETKTATSVFEMLALDMSLDEEKPCEKSDHVWSDVHEGPGEWYIQYKCPGGCVYDTGSRVMLICTKSKEWYLSDGTYCSDCCREWGPGEGFVFVERK